MRSAGCPALILSLALTACGDGATAGGDAIGGDVNHVDDTRPPTPWIYESDAAATPSLSAGHREAAIAAALDALVELDPAAVRELHDALFPPPAIGSGDVAGCPFYLTYDYGTATAWYWQGECTAADGTMFSGRGYIGEYAGYEADGAILDGWAFSLAGRIEGPDGTWLEATGSGADYTGAAGDVDLFSRALDGTFLAGGPGAPSSPWLDGSRRPSATLLGFTYRPTAGNGLAVDGGIAGVSDFPGGVSAVAFDGLTFRERAAGASCDREPGGTVSVRAADGSWYDMAFDGPTEAAPETDAASCDGCGATWFRGTEVDATCVPAAPWLDWEGAPW